MRIRNDGGSREIALEVVPVKPAGASDDCFLILFDEPTASTAPTAPSAPSEAWAPDRDQVTQLRQELDATKEYLQSMVEQQDAANEELRSANEEILSSNEELQSTNEELQTAKEELQSSNEELITVNEQLQQRNIELSEANNDQMNLLSSTNLPVVMVGSDLRIRRVTAPAREALNLLPTDIGRPIGDIKPPFDGDLGAFIREVIESGQPRDKEVTDLKGRWHSLRVYPYHIANDKVTGAVIVLVDIDPHKRAEQTLREADRRKDEFLATLAHELRNPLAPIRNAVEILRLAAADSPMAVQARDVLSRQVNQMSRIVEDLIDVSRIVEKKVELRASRHDVAGAINAAVETCRSYLESCRHEVTVSVPLEPLELDGDPERITQVLINLLSNAGKYTEPGGRIWLEAARESAAWIVVRVRDTGIGIDAALLPHIFEMFTQGSEAPDHGRGGLGVGLALARSLVQMHNGTLEAHSKGPGQGTEFIMRLPCGTPAAAGTLALSESAGTWCDLASTRIGRRRQSRSDTEPRPALGTDGTRGPSRPRRTERTGRRRRVRTRRCLD